MWNAINTCSHSQQSMKTGEFNFILIFIVVSGICVERNSWFSSNRYYFIWVWVCVCGRICVCVCARELEFILTISWMRIWAIWSYNITQRIETRRGPNEIKRISAFSLPRGYKLDAIETSRAYRFVIAESSIITIYSARNAHTRLVSECLRKRRWPQSIQCYTMCQCVHNCSVYHTPMSSGDGHLSYGSCNLAAQSQSIMRKTHIRHTLLTFCTFTST